jgi:cell division protein FtsB
MSRRPTPEPPDPDLDPEVDDALVAADAPAGGGPSIVAPDLAALPIAGITRRRVAAVLGVLLATWIVVLFARQVGEAQAAVATADRIAADNVAKGLEVASLERELELIAREKYVAQQARGYGLGTPREIPFTLDRGAPSLPPDAPGSATQRLGAELERISPLERWLTVLFGPSG